LVFDGGDEPSQLPGSLQLHGAQPSGRYRGVEEFAQQLGGAFQRQVLAIHEIHGQRPHLRHPTHRRLGGGRELAERFMTAHAATSLGDMVDHVHLHLWNVEDRRRTSPTTSAVLRSCPHAPPHTGP